MRLLRLLLLLALPCFARAETGAAGWLRYARITDPVALKSQKRPQQIVQTGQDPVSRNAAAELARGLPGSLIFIRSNAAYLVRETHL